MPHDCLPDNHCMSNTATGRTFRVLACDHMTGGVVAVATGLTLRAAGRVCGQHERRSVAPLTSFVVSAEQFGWSANDDDDLQRYPAAIEGAA